MNRKIVITDGKIEVENGENVAAVITDLVVAIVALSKSSGLPRRTLFKAIRSAWRNTKAEDVD